MKDDSMRPVHFKVLMLALVTILLGSFTGCGNSVTTKVEPEPDNPFLAFRVGSDSSLDVVTWNLHNFAEDDGNNEVALVAKAIEGLGADIVAIQEIAQGHRFDQLLDALPNHSGYQATSDNYQNLGYVWLDSTVTVERVYEWEPDIEDPWRPFPRTPLLLEITWSGATVTLINNHFKCCGDGQLNPDYPGDEEKRRLDASQYLADYMRSDLADDSVILLGDLNDLLTDPVIHNAFMPFYDHPDHFRFADQAVAEGPSSGWSWGPGGSHLDHILVSDELFAALGAQGADCMTVRIDQQLDGEYRDKISDHLPVAVVLPGAALPTP